MKICVPKMTTQTLLDFDLEESSSDSDFRIEDHDGSDEDVSENSDAADSRGDEDDDEEDSDGMECSGEGTDFSDFKASLLSGSSAKRALKKNLTTAKDPDFLIKAKEIQIPDKLSTKLICCACLGDRSDDTNEIVECDGCGISVHEGCYGVSDSNSVSSTISSCSTEPWFCEACRACVRDPICELCPNRGGIFKETDVGKWVHLVCALYVPGVAFGEVDHLSSVTLFEMQYNKWGAKTCNLCDEGKFARTGVCIGCDAGMCKTYFHVTCAQAAGFLSEPHSEEADHADPFYAHCKVHSDKTMIKHRKRNYNSLRLRINQRKILKKDQHGEKPTAEQLRIQRKLQKHQKKYRSMKKIKLEPWVPTQKITRLLTTSASAIRKLMLKSELMGIDTAALEFQEAQMAALTDVRKKWHIPAAFSVEFIGYYLDRIGRLKDLKSSLEHHVNMNRKLIGEQHYLREKYDTKVQENSDYAARNKVLKDKLAELHKQMQVLCPNKLLVILDNVGQLSVTSTASSSPSAAPLPVRPMSVPTAAALKMGVGFPLTNLPGGPKDDTGRILSTQRQDESDLVHECGICKRCSDQHLLAKCDTCHLFYHLGCLNPPLTRHPKKSKLYGWQCSECDKSDDPDAVANLPKGPRKSRTRFNKDGTIVPVDSNLSSGNTEENLSVKSEQSPTKRKSSAGKNPRQLSLDEDKLVGQNLSAAFSKSHCMTVGTHNSIKSVAKKTKGSSLKRNSMENSDCLPSKEQGLTETKLKEKVELLSSDRNFGYSSINLGEKHKKKSKKPKETHINIEVAQLAEGSHKTQGVIEQGAFHSAPSTSLGSNRQSPIIAMGFVCDMDTTVEENHKANRKRRKDKHRNKTMSSSEKSPTKEHKRKRKKKNHHLSDLENPKDGLTVPKIKIKFKTLPLPGEVAPEPQFFYVSADMVRPLDTSRPTSVETIEETGLNPAENQRQMLERSAQFYNEATSVQLQQSIMSPSKQSAASRISYKMHQSQPVGVGFKPAGRISSSRKSTSEVATTPVRNWIGINCDVCNKPGTHQNIVRCDECQKNYHFMCLDPPLKKSPKRRGYSWICAECDPTDLESS